VSEFKPLHHGAIAVLAAAGADVHARDERDSTPLHWAAGRGLQSSTFQLILDRFRHKISPKHLLVPPDTSSTPPKHPLNAPLVPRKRADVQLESGRV